MLRFSCHGIIRQRCATVTAITESGGPGRRGSESAERTPGHGCMRILTAPAHCNEARREQTRNLLRRSSRCPSVAAGPEEYQPLSRENHCELRTGSRISCRELGGDKKIVSANRRAVLNAENIFREHPCGRNAGTLIDLLHAKQRGNTRYTFVEWALDSLLKV